MKNIRLWAGLAVVACGMAAAVETASACVPRDFFQRNEYHLALQALRNGQKEQATELLKKVVAGTFPAFQKANADFQLGKLAQEAGRRHQAMAHFERAIRLSPSHSLARLHLGIAHVQA